MLGRSTVILHLSKLLRSGELLQLSAWGMSSFCLNWHLKLHLVLFYFFQDKICSGSHVVRCNIARTSILPPNNHRHSVVYHSSSKHRHENFSLQSDISLLNIQIFHNDVKTQKEKREWRIRKNNRGWVISYIMYMYGKCNKIIYFLQIEIYL